ncbi:MAG: extracellular solute-binding protein, partial [Myxococcota bacterium]
MRSWFVRALCVYAVSGAAATSAQTDATELQLWHAYTGAEEEALREAVRAFERQSEGRYEVELLAVAFGAYLAKLESAIPTGRGPDVFIDAHERLANYVGARLIQPVETSLPIDDAYLAALDYEGERWGIPLSVKCAALYLNRDLIEHPESLEALLATDVGDRYPLVLEAENAYYVAALLHAYGGTLLTDEGDYAFEGDAAEQTV